MPGIARGQVQPDIAACLHQGAELIRLIHVIPAQHSAVVEDGPGTCLTNNSVDGSNLEMSYPSLVEGEDAAREYRRNQLKDYAAYIGGHPERDFSLSEFKARHILLEDEAAAREVIAELETDKANVDLEMPATGRLTEILVEAGTDAAVGTVLARYEEA